MNIGIYGGTFNPIHHGHLLLAQSAMEEYRLDKVLFIVSVNPPHKDKKNMLSFEHRFRMTELAVKDCHKFFVSDIEKEIVGKSYTYYVIEKIAEKYGAGHNYFLIMGEDEADYFINWFRYEDILKKCRIIVGHRDSEFPSNDINFEFIRTPRIEISSSDLREKIRMGKSVLYYTPTTVCDYISENRLYL